MIHVLQVILIPTSFQGCCNLCFIFQTKSAYVHQLISVSLAPPSLSSFLPNSVDSDNGLLLLRNYYMALLENKWIYPIAHAKVHGFQVRLVPRICTSGLGLGLGQAVWGREISPAKTIPSAFHQAECFSVLSTDSCILAIKPSAYGAPYIRLSGLSQFSQNE
jgi:hypothetical protein